MVEADFQSVEEARQTYYGGEGEQPAQWGDPQVVERFPAGQWQLLRQADLRQDSDRARFFVFRSVDAIEGLDANGNAQSIAPDAPIGDLPSFETKPDARAAYNAWAEANDKQTVDEGEDGTDSQDGKGDDGSGQWSEFQQVDQAAGWVIYRRQHLTEDRQQWLAGSQNEAGEDIFLAPEGKIQQEPHIFDSRQALTDAIAAFVERANRGDVPQGSTPTGTAPGQGSMPGGRPSQTPGGGLLREASQAAGGPQNLILLLIVAALAVYYLEKTGRIDLLDSVGE
jgi:hypothetical protein